MRARKRRASVNRKSRKSVSNILESCSSTPEMIRKFKFAGYEVFSLGNDRYAVYPKGETKGKILGFDRDMNMKIIKPVRRGFKGTGTGR